MTPKHRITYRPLGFPDVTEPLASLHLGRIRWNEQSDVAHHDVAFKDQQAYLLHAIEATKAAQWLLNYKDRLPPLTTLHPTRLPRLTKTPPTVEHKIQRALWLINQRIDVSILRHHPLLDLMRAQEPADTRGNDELTVEQLCELQPSAAVNAPSSEENAQQFAKRLKALNTTIRHSGFQTRIQHFQRLARKRHQRRVQHLNMLIDAHASLRLVRLDTGYWSHAVRPDEALATRPRPRRYSPEWVRHLQTDRDNMIKAMKRSSVFQGVAGYQWQLMCSPVLGFYIHWWCLFTEAVPERSEIIGQWWREHASLDGGVSVHAKTETAMLERIHSSEAGCLERWQDLVECQAGIDYYLQLASDQLLNEEQRKEIEALRWEGKRKRPAHAKTMGVGVIRKNS